MPPRWHCAATTISRSSSSTSASRAISPACSAAAARRRSFRTKENEMPAYDKADIQRRMHGAVEALKHDLGGLRTGRASISPLEPVAVEGYGAHMPINQVASISVPQPRMLSVQGLGRPDGGAGREGRPPAR